MSNIPDAKQRLIVTGELSIDGSAGYNQSTALINFNTKVVNSYKDLAQIRCFGGFGNYTLLLDASGSNGGVVVRANTTQGDPSYLLNAQNDQYSLKVASNTGETVIKRLLVQLENTQFKNTFDGQPIFTVTKPNTTLATATLRNNITTFKLDSWRIGETMDIELGAGFSGSCLWGYTTPTSTNTSSVDNYSSLSMKRSGTVTENIRMFTDGTVNIPVKLTATTINATTYENLPPVPASQLQPLTLDQTNNRVGINNTVPTQALDVVGTASITANTDGVKLLTFNTDRPWYFQSTGTGAATKLELVCDSGKTFAIKGGTQPYFECFISGTRTQTNFFGYVACTSQADGTGGEIFANRIVSGWTSTSVAVGNGAGWGGGTNVKQAAGSVAVGNTAGFSGQGVGAVAIGTNSGNVNQKPYSVAIGSNAGKTTQGESSVGIGNFAGGTTQGDAAVAIGKYVGAEGQGANAVAIGSQAGQYLQSDGAIAIGFNAGRGTSTTDTRQGIWAVAIGNYAGNNTQAQYAIAVGNNAGQIEQKDGSVSVGDGSGNNKQGLNAIAVGRYSGAINQGDWAIAIGTNAGNSGQGANAIAIGIRAGMLNQHANSIILNATGSNTNSDGASRFYVKPIRSLVDPTLPRLSYNATTGEICYGDSTTTSLLPITLDKVNNRVGINRTTPTAALDVNGKSVFGDDMTVNADLITLGNAISQVTVKSVMNCQGTVTVRNLNISAPSSATKPDVLYYDATSKAVSYGPAPGGGSVFTPVKTVSQTSSPVTIDGMARNFLPITLERGYHNLTYQYNLGTLIGVHVIATIKSDTTNYSYRQLTYNDTNPRYTSETLSCGIYVTAPETVYLQLARFPDPGTTTIVCTAIQVTNV